MAATLEPARLIEALCEAARRAGAEIMAVYAAPFDTGSKQDGSPVTEADLRADRAIRTALEQLAPGVPIVSEESSPDLRAAGERFFLVDPLDGTREFVARRPEFTVNIALIESGEPVAGVVLLPVSGTLYAGARSLGAWREKGGPREPIRVAPRHAGPLRVLDSRSHRTPQTQQWLASLPRACDIEEAGSSLKFCRIAQGDADLYARLGPTSQWDTAAGQAVLCAAGGAVLVAPGQPLRYGGDRPLINPFFVALADPHMDFPPLA